jgi:hypothetical protein
MVSLLKYTPNPDYAIVIIIELLLLLLTAPFHFFTAVLPRKSSQSDWPRQSPTNLRITYRLNVSLYLSIYYARCYT